MLVRKKWGLLALLAFIFLAVPNAALAQDALDTGDTAWILISTGLVLFMMIPGLAMFTLVWSARAMCSRSLCTALGLRP